MHPVRLVILAVLIYIGYRLIISSWRKRKSKPVKKSSHVGGPSVTDVLVEDPICHTLIPKKQAVRLQVDETMVYFCSEKCCDIFVRKQGEHK